jgi:2-oxoisovalerate dehydrogenase E2 component (dihydrolipoyl transacylase)
MPCAREFLLPDLGEGLAEAEVVRWLVEVGDMVVVDQPVVEVETAKAVVEVPCPYAGVVSQVAAGPGHSVRVGHPLITVMVEEHDSSEQVPVAAAVPQVLGSGNVLVGYGTSTEPRRRRRPAQTGPREPVRVISPVVRRLAEQYSLDLYQVAGSGPQGLVQRSDVERAIAALTVPGETGERHHPVAQQRTRSADGPVRNGSPQGSAAVPRVRAEFRAREERVPLTGIRAAAAAKYSRSRTEIPDATCWVDADATELMAARAVLGTGLLPLLARICVAALARYPQFNAEFDAAGNEVVRHLAVNLGFAAQTPRGLAVPVVHGADRLGTGQLAAELGRLTEEARAGTLAPAALSRGTFTLNNYGVFGVDGSTPILNAPQAAMLGIGRVAARPWVHQGELAVRQVVQLSFTFDHRVCDGAEAGGFLRYVADAVEQPVLLLREL